MTKSEQEPRLPKLAEGSRWVDNGSVVSRDMLQIGATGELGDGVDGALVVTFENGPVAQTMYVGAVDALAVIRHADLDPLAIAAKELAKACRSGSVAIHGGQRDAGSFFAALEKLEALL